MSESELKKRIKEKSRFAEDYDLTSEEVFDILDAMWAEFPKFSTTRVDIMVLLDIEKWLKKWFGEQNAKE